MNVDMEQWFLNWGGAKGSQRSASMWQRHGLGKQD